MTLAVIVAMRGAREGDVAAAIDAHPDLTVARRAADLVEAVAAARAGLAAAVVVSEQTHLTRAVLADLERSGVGVVAAAAGADAADHLTSLGIDHVVRVDQSLDALIPALLSMADHLPAAAAMEAEAAASPATHGAMVAVWGPTGAPGRTTVAINLAAEIAAAGEDAIIADADTYGGAVGPSLGLLDEAPGIAALVRAADRGVVSAADVARYAKEVSPGLRAVSGIGRAERWPEIAAAPLAEVWASLRGHAALTVVDCGFSIEVGSGYGLDRNAATIATLGCADAVVVVGSAEPLGIQRVVQALQELEALAEVTAPVTVVINKVRASVAGHSPRSAVADALAKYAGVSEVWTAPWDPKASDSAVLAGRVLAECAPKSALRRALQPLAAHVYGVASERANPALIG
jgi:MinD-like ATPase involved in chromosome partitioning or flagellar assembly